MKSNVKAVVYMVIFTLVSIILLSECIFNPFRVSKTDRILKWMNSNYDDTFVHSEPFGGGINIDDECRQYIKNLTGGHNV